MAHNGALASPPAIKRRRPLFLIDPDDCDMPDAEK